MRKISLLIITLLLTLNISLAVASQNDLDIASGQSGTNFRTDVNSALQALGSSSSGATAPSTTYPFQLWGDTTNDYLKVRNEANDTWVSFGYISPSNNTFTFIRGGVIVPGVYANFTAAATACTDHVMIIDESVTLDANTTTPPGCEVIIREGGSITAGGFTLDIDGYFDAGSYAVFSGFSSGDVTFADKAPLIDPIWWGENTTPGTTDMTDEINSAFDACIGTDSGTGTVEFRQRGVYAVDSQLNLGDYDTPTQKSCNVVMPVGAVIDSSLATTYALTIDNLSYSDIELRMKTDTSNAIVRQNGTSSRNLNIHGRIEYKGDHNGTETAGYRMARKPTIAEVEANSVSGAVTGITFEAATSPYANYFHNTHDMIIELYDAGVLTQYSANGQYINDVTVYDGWYGYIILGGDSYIFGGFCDHMGAVSGEYETIPFSDVSIAADTFTFTGTVFSDDEEVKISSTGTVPGPLSPNQVYYIVNKAANTFQLSLTEGGSAANLTSQGTGNHTVTQFSECLHVGTASGGNTAGGLTADISAEPGSGTVKNDSMMFMLDDTATSECKIEMRDDASGASINKSGVEHTIETQDYVRSDTVWANENLRVGGTLRIGNQSEGETGTMNYKTLNEEVTLTGATTDTTIQVPSGAIILGAQFTVDEVVSSTGGDPDTWTAAFVTGATDNMTPGGAQSSAVDTQVDTSIVGTKTTAASSIRFTPDAGNFDGGKIEVNIFYRDITSMGQSGKHYNANDSY